MILLKPLFLFVLMLLCAAPDVRAQDAAPVVPAAPAVQTPQKPALTGKVMYRNFILGVSKEDVRKYETAAFYKDEGTSLYYLYEQDFFRRQIRYDFDNNKLVGIRLDVMELSMPNSLRIIEMIQDEEKALTDLYGPPAKSEFFWKSKKYEKFPEYWGRALYQKDLQIQITWALADAEIVLQAYHDGRFYQLHYTIQPLAEPAARTNALDLLPATAPDAAAVPQTQP